MTTLNTPWKIRVYQYRVIISALQLEQKGMRHSKGSIRARWAEKLGLKVRDTREKYIAALEKLIADEVNIQEQLDFDLMVEHRAEERDLFEGPDHD